MLILLSGTPGTGKTSVGRILEEELSCRLANSSRLAYSLRLTVRDPTGRYTMLLESDRIGLLVEHSVRLAKQGCLLLETVYPELWIGEQGLHPEVVLVILLRAHPLVVLERLQQRGWPEEKVLENAAAEAFNVIAESLLPVQYDVVEVDTSRLTPAAAARRVLDLIVEWRTGIRIDWLGDEHVQDMLPRLMLRLDSDKHRLGV